MKVSIKLNAKYSVQVGLVDRSQTKWWISLEVLVDKLVSKVYIVLWVTSKIIELGQVLNRCKQITWIKECNIDRIVLLDLISLRCKLKTNNLFKANIVVKEFRHQQVKIQLWEVINKICILVFYQTIFY